METKLIIEWSIFAAVIIALIYTMIVIKEEKRSYQENARPVQFHALKLLVPSWWTQTLNEKDKICFERTDTRYEWKATLSLKPMQTDRTVEESLLEWLKEKDVLFDEQNSVIHNPESFHRHPCVESGEWEIVRLEGTATQAQIERVYLDTYLIRDKKEGLHYFCESRSSVLNGLIEGPYFEEMMNNVEKLS